MFGLGFREFDLFVKWWVEEFPLGFQTSFGGGVGTLWGETAVLAFYRVSWLTMFGGPLG